MKGAQGHFPPVVGERGEVVVRPLTVTGRVWRRGVSRRGRRSWPPEAWGIVALLAIGGLVIYWQISASVNTVAAPAVPSGAYVFGEEVMQVDCRQAAAGVTQCEWRMLPGTGCDAGGGGCPGRGP